MATVAPVKLWAAVHAVAEVLDGAQMRVVGLAGREAYSFESASAVVTVSVHLGTARDIDRVADLLVLGLGDLSQCEDLYSRGSHHWPGVYVSLYGPPHRAAAVVVGVAS